MQIVSCLHTKETKETIDILLLEQIDGDTTMYLTTSASC